MKFELSESELKRNLDWLKKENGSLNDYGTVIRHLLNEIEELKQRQETRPHETVVIFDTPEKAEEGALLLARIRQISQNQLSSKQVKRMNELIKATGFELHHRK